MYNSVIKPILEFLFALFCFALISPVFLIIVILLYFANDGKVFFVQKRPGKKRRIFNIYKFKTMNDRRDANGNLLPDAERLTVVGNAIRKASLDEIPQLLNVLKGDMSFVGPRPLLTTYLHLYNDFQNRRHEVKPGITGWAQVNGRNAISWDQKFEYDVWYVDHVSFGLDFKIFMMTLGKVFKSEGINAAETTTMEPFSGE